MKILLPTNITRLEQWIHADDFIYYSSVSECIEYIHQNKTTEKLIVVIDGQSDEQKILPFVKGLEWIRAIFIVNSQNEECIKRTRRFTDLNSLFDYFETTIDERQSQKLALHFLSQNERSMLDLSTEKANFMWNRILLVALQQLPSEARSFQTMVDAFITFCGEDKVKLKEIDEFRRNYEPNKAIEWYTRPGTIFQLINLALRTRSIDGLLTFSPFICDLHNQIINEQTQQCNTKRSKKVYRGQILHISELEHFRKSIGKLVSMTTFFSTSYDQGIAQLFMGSSKTNDFVRVLFIIRVKSSLKSTICADISHISLIEDERELLFSLSAVFHVDAVRPNARSDYWKIFLSATDKGREAFEKYVEIILKYTEYDDPYIMCGQVLFQMGLYEKAHQYYTSWKKFLPYTNRLPTALHNIYHARALFLWGKYPEALQILLEAESILNDLGYGSESIQYWKCRFNIANTHIFLGNYRDALHIYRETLAVQRQILSQDHRFIADNICGISWALGYIGDIDQALIHALESLKMRRRYLPPHHPTIAHALRGIGELYDIQGRWQKSEQYFLHGHKMTIKYLPPNHVHHAFSLLHLGLPCEHRGEYDKALEYYLQALNIYKQIFNGEHPSIAITLDSIGNVYRQKRKFTDAYDSSYLALKMRHQLLPIDHVSFSTTYASLASVFLDVRDDHSAIEYFTKALELQKRYLDSKHYMICRTLSYRATAYSHDGQLELAKDIFEQVLSIQQAKYPRGHPDIGLTMHHMASNYCRLNRIDQAIAFYRNSLEINKKFYPIHHNEIKSVEKKLQQLQSNLHPGQQLNTIHHIVVFCIILFLLILICLFLRSIAFRSIYS